MSGGFVGDLTQCQIIIYLGHTQASQSADLIAPGLRQSRLSIHHFEIISNATDKAILCLLHQTLGQIQS